LFNLAISGDPPSPLYPDIPFPAIVVIVFVAIVNLRSMLFPASAIYMFEYVASNAIPIGPFKVDVAPVSPL